MPDTTRRWFADEFKSEAVRLTRESGRPVAQWGSQLGFSWVGCGSEEQQPCFCTQRQLD